MGNFPDFATMLANTFAEDLMQVVTWIFLVVATLIVPLAIWLGFKLAKAGDPNKRREAKKHMINAIASLIIILILIGAMQIPALWANIGDGGGSGGGGGGGGSGAGWTLHPNVVQAGQSRTLQVTHNRVLMTEATFTIVSGPGTISGSEFTAGATQGVVVVSVSVPGQRVPNMNIIVTNEHVPETTPPGAGGGEPVGPVGPPATIGNNGGLTNVPEEDRHLLARLIWAEARGEYGRGSGDALDPLVAVGAVVVNRVKANFDLFTRDTNIRGAVTRAHQFPSPWASTGAHTAVDNDFPNNRYVRAADAAIAGRDPTNGMHIFWTRWLWEREVNNNFSGQTWVGSVNNVSRTQIYETGTTGPWSTSVPQRGTAGNPGILGEGNVFFQMVQWDNAMGRSLAAPMNFSYGVELFQVGPMLANTFAEDLMQVVTWIFLVVATLIVPLAIWLGFKLAKAGDPNKRREAKKHMINAVASLIIILILIGAMQIPALWANIGDGGGSGGGGGGGGSGAGWTMHPNVMQTGTSHALTLTHGGVVITDATFTVVSGGGSISGNVFTAGSTESVAVISVSVPGQRVPNQQIVITRNEVNIPPPPGGGGVGGGGPPWEGGGEHLLPPPGLENVTVRGIRAESTNSGAPTLNMQGNFSNGPNGPFTDDDIYVLARLIQAEASDPTAQLGVGAVIFNRMITGISGGPSVVDTILRGGQWAPMWTDSATGGTGAFNNTAVSGPSASAIDAARRALAGGAPAQFLNPATGEPHRDFWGAMQANNPASIPSWSLNSSGHPAFPNSLVVIGGKRFWRVGNMAPAGTSAGIYCEEDVVFYFVTSTVTFMERRRVYEYFSY